MAPRLAAADDRACAGAALFKTTCCEQYACTMCILEYLHSQDIPVVASEAALVEKLPSVKCPYCATPVQFQKARAPARTRAARAVAEAEAYRLMRVAAVRRCCRLKRRGGMKTPQLWYGSWRPGCREGHTRAGRSRLR